jgi:transcriptional regulator with XRE-family HTH domain
VKNLVGKAVRNARKRHVPPLPQEQLATLLQLDGWNIGRGTPAKNEAGIRQVTDIEVMRLAKALDIPPESLLDKEEFSLLFKPE